MKLRLAWKIKKDYLCQCIQAHIGNQGVKCSSKFMTAFGNFVSFITNTGDVSTANNSNLHELISNPTKSTQLQMELVIAIDVGNILVKITYNFEGDGPLALSIYEHISLLSSFIPILLLLLINYLVLIKAFISNCMTTYYHVQNQHMITFSLRFAMISNYH